MINMLSLIIKNVSKNKFTVVVNFNKSFTENRMIAQEVQPPDVRES